MYVIFTSHLDLINKHVIYGPLTGVRADITVVSTNNHTTLAFVHEKGFKVGEEYYIQMLILSTDDYIHWLEDNKGGQYVFY